MRGTCSGIGGHNKCLQTFVGKPEKTIRDIRRLGGGGATGTVKVDFRRKLWCELLCT
jgi:hypothetical protein